MCLRKTRKAGDSEIWYSTDKRRVWGLDRVNSGGGGNFAVCGLFYAPDTVVKQLNLI